MCGIHVYKSSLAPEQSSYSIVHLEMLNILVATHVWHSTWKDQKILIQCENQIVVSVLNTDRTKDRTLVVAKCNIQLVAVLSNIDIVTIHILGKNNPIADLLLRWQSKTSPHAKLIPIHNWVNSPYSYMDIN